MKKCHIIMFRNIVKRQAHTFFSKDGLKKIVVPNLGDSITESTVYNIPLRRCSWVKADTPVIFLETAKSILSVNAPTNGQVYKYYVKEEDELEEGDVICTFRDGKPDHESIYVEVDSIP